MATPSITDPSSLPLQSHITLLLKHRKSTTLLSISPSQPFSEIKSLLLAALRSRDITSLSTTQATQVPLPSDSDDLEFGILADKKDPTKGWISLDSYTFSKDKKKVPGRSKVTAGANSPEAAGLGDGGLVAYRLRKPNKGKEREKSVDSDDEDVDVDIAMDDDHGWDVVLPTFEDEDREAETEAEKMLEGMEGP